MYCYFWRYNFLRCCKGTVCQCNFSYSVLINPLVVQQSLKNFFWMLKLTGEIYQYLTKKPQLFQRETQTLKISCWYGNFPYWTCCLVFSPFPLMLLMSLELWYRTIQCRQKGWWALNHLIFPSFYFFWDSRWRVVTSVQLETHSEMRLYGSLKPKPSSLVSDAAL